jgi:hypothetical protein
MRGKIGFAGLAILALTITAIFGGAANADPVAQTAGLKKCLKKAKAIEDPVKRKRAKKRCRRKFAVAPGTVPVLTPTPTVRATLTWTGGGTSTDYDLYVFDPSGATASTRFASNPIANTTLSGNVTGGSGTETFTDLKYTNPGARTFVFGVCHQDGGSDGTSYSIKYVTADGVTHTDARSGGSDGFNAKYSGGPPALQSFAPGTCPAP